MTETFRPYIVPSFTVAAIEPLRDFYIEKLGFEHMMAIKGEDGLLDTAIVIRDGMSVMIGRADGVAGEGEPGENVSRGIELNFYIEDVDAYHDEVVRRGVTVLDPPTTHWWGDRTFRVTDPYGHSLQFAQIVGEFQPPEGVEAI